MHICVSERESYTCLFVYIHALPYIYSICPFQLISFMHASIIQGLCDIKYY